jgi:hypothetical protein
MGQKAIWQKAKVLKNLINVNNEDAPEFLWVIGEPFLHNLYPENGLIIRTNHDYIDGRHNHINLKLIELLPEFSEDVEIVRLPI